jgi:hypothetical protein
MLLTSLWICAGVRFVEELVWIFQAVSIEVIFYYFMLFPKVRVRLTGEFRKHIELFRFDSVN